MSTYTESKKKISLIRPGYHTLDHFLAHELANSGFEVELHVPHRFKDKVYEGVNYSVITYKTYFSDSLADYPITIQLFFNLVRSNSNLIHVSEDYQYISLLGALASFFRRSQFALMIEKFGPPRFRNDRIIFKFFTLFISPFLWWKASFILCHSNASVRYMKKKMPKRFYKKMEQLSIGVDSDVFKYDPLIEKEEEFTFITVGRFDIKKNYPMLLQAFASIVEDGHSVRLKIIGGEVPRSKDAVNVLEIIKSLGIEQYVDVVDKVPHENLYLEYNKSHVFILSSILEMMGVVILEAMSCGLPVVVTDVGGMVDFIDGNGVVVESENVKQLADAMVTIKIDENLRNVYSKRSLELIRNRFNNRIVLANHSKLFSKYL